MYKLKKIVFLCLFITNVVAYSQETTSKVQMSIFAENPQQWTGIAISKTNRVFVNFPRWSPETPVSVAEIIDGKTIPFPNPHWNNWTENTSNNNQFICVQSMYVDSKDLLWVLDTGYELLTDTTKGARLFCFDLKNNTLIHNYFLPAEKITSKAYLNDFRIDHKNHIAYFTDSQIGGIVMFDLNTTEVRRVLVNHYSTLTEVDKIIIEGYERKHPVHSDGIELDAPSGYLYFCSLMGKNVYRIPVAYLLDKNISDTELGTKVEKYAQTGANDGIIFNKKGELFLSSLEKNAISKINKQGVFTEIIKDDAIKWPDSFAFDNQVNLYFTTSQIHLPKEKRSTYKIFKLKF
ncbi:SMP-30/gluconolactonase/LRE family protein [Chryseobacterium sp. LAM-KRS1]|uniref:SMP-30/gluconolactonase/LRE family protein n=1 Tax=Chryseobacterium sp. LAM-KRS1 TaxID=2715754 RepID=UPI001554BED6|nr:L-dopachrome tautomerase-related protein [Chryseobacterium sp. LAM-KRS1]